MRLVIRDTASPLSPNLFANQPPDSLFLSLIIPRCRPFRATEERRTRDWENQRVLGRKITARLKRRVNGRLFQIQKAASRRLKRARKNASRRRNGAKEKRERGKEGKRVRGKGDDGRNGAIKLVHMRGGVGISRVKRDVGVCSRRNICMSSSSSARKVRIPIRRANSGSWSQRGWRGAIRVARRSFKSLPANRRAGNLVEGRWRYDKRRNSIGDPRVLSGSQG